MFSPHLFSIVFEHLRYCSSCLFWQLHGNYQKRSKSLTSGNFHDAQKLSCNQGMLHLGKATGKDGNLVRIEAFWNRCPDANVAHGTRLRSITEEKVPAHNVSESKASETGLYEPDWTRLNRSWKRHNIRGAQSSAQPKNLHKPSKVFNCWRQDNVQICTHYMTEKGRRGHNIPHYPTEFQHGSPRNCDEKIYNAGTAIGLKAKALASAQCLISDSY